MAKGTKMNAEKEATLSKELTPKQKYECLQSLLHSRMAHVDKIYITEDGNFHFSQGHKLQQSRDLNPQDEKDAKLIASSGRTRITETLPGTYINRKKVIDEIDKDDFLIDGEDIIAQYNAILKKEREEKKKQMANDPDATAELLADMLKNGAAKA